MPIVEFVRDNPIILLALIGAWVLLGFMRIAVEAYR